MELAQARVELASAEQRQNRMQQQRDVFVSELEGVRVRLVDAEVPQTADLRQRPSSGY